jgi:hypothetical protein
MITSWKCNSLPFGDTDFPSEEPSSSFRKLLPGLETIYVAPKYLNLMAGKNKNEISVATLDSLDLAYSSENIGSRFGCFDVLDATKGLMHFWGIRFTPPINEGVDEEEDTAGAEDEGEDQVEDE